MFLIELYRKYVPSNIKQLLLLGYRVNKVKEFYYIRTAKENHQKALSKLVGKDKINCVFFALFDSVWKYEDVYRLMLDNPRFDPVILVCPVANYGRENMLFRMKETYNFFKKKGYNVIKSYDEISDTYVDVRKDINPDIIFYTNPYDNLIDTRYFITNFRDILTVYVPYSINNSCAYDANYNLILYNLLWRYYLPTPYHQNYSVEYARNKGVNTVVSGYPGIEPLLDGRIPCDKDWKDKNPNVKRIIWAPHHTIEPVGVVYYSCFLKYCDFMLEIAHKYEGKIQVVFKPHPLLKNKLYLLWGKERTDEYYSKWERMPNTNLNDGDYEDLFLTSDAMIHDSGSFISEYLYVNKPVMRTLNGIDESEKQNGFSLECISNHYLANDEHDIEQFIQNVIAGIDPIKEKRTKFINDVLMPNGSPSLNIIDDILDSINNQILYRD